MNLSPSFTLTIIHFPFQKDFSSSLACDFLKPEKKLYHNMKWANLIFAPFIFIVSFSMAFAAPLNDGTMVKVKEVNDSLAPPSPSAESGKKAVTPELKKCAEKKWKLAEREIPSPASSGLVTNLVHYAFMPAQYLLGIAAKHMYQQWEKTSNKTVTLGGHSVGHNVNLAESQHSESNNLQGKRHSKGGGQSRK